MKVFGADFSGTRNPSRGIYYAEGRLDNSTLQIEMLGGQPAGYEETAKLFCCENIM